MAAIIAGLLFVVSMADPAHQPAPEIQDAVDPLEVARAEGEVRQEIAACPMSDDLRTHALELSGRAATAIVRVYGLSAHELSEKLGEGEASARRRATNPAAPAACGEVKAACLLMMMSERDAAIAQLLGPPRTARPSSWPVAGSVTCDAGGVPEPSNGDAPTPPATTKPPAASA